MSIDAEPYVLATFGAAIPRSRCRSSGNRELFAATGTDNGFEMTVVTGPEAQYAIRRHCGSADQNEDGEYIADASRDPLHKDRLNPYPS
jgi:hypothetical protein